MSGGTSDQDCIELKANANVSAGLYGARASEIMTLQTVQLPVPRSWAISANAVRKIAKSGINRNGLISSVLQEGAIVSVRASPIKWEWGGPETLLNVGMNEKTCQKLSKKIGPLYAHILYRAMQLTPVPTRCCV